MSGDRKDIPDGILEAASDWLFRLHAAPADMGVRRQLEAWLAADARHDRAWQAAREAWTVTGAVAPAFVTPHPSKPRFVRRPHLMGMALAAGLAAVALLPGLAIEFLADHRTSIAESRPVDLDDGSTVTLAAESAMATDLSGAARSVSLLRGEAHFEVKADRARPFVVSGGGITVTVTGTAFDVSVSDRIAMVNVAEGSVVVAHGDDKTHLSAGQGVVIDRSTGTIDRRRVDPGDVGAWRQGRLTVGDVPLSSVIDALRRNHRGVILLTDDSLGRKHVTGIYDLSEPERALRALVGPHGGMVRRLTPFILVVSAG